MKTMLVTTPIRPTPTNFVPIGSLNILTYLRKNDIDVEFYHIDALRPKYEDAIAHIVAAKPDVLGISAVVSTAYAYTKMMISDVKKALPDTLIVIGGSLAASAEILLRIAGADFCALGEGEKIMLNVVRRAQTTRIPADFSDIPGLVLLDRDNKLVNTGYETQLKKEELYDIDWVDLEKSCDISTYVSPIDLDGKIDFWFEKDERSYQEHRKNKKILCFPTAKGCVAKCTFCHRWDKGIRYIPSEVLRSRIQEVVDRYDVGFLNIADENFGTDKKWLVEFCNTIKPFDLLWRVAGMRVNCITPEYIELMKDAGCVSILYGMETGSEKILEVMEKKVKLQDNYNAMKWTIDADQKTVVQLVIGMPGESPSTIRETAKFSAYACSIAPWQRPWDLSINYAQALPGTPLYEYARRLGQIGTSLEDEEAYLLKISDRNASDEYSTLNFTAYPYPIHRSWRQYIQLKAANAYIDKFGKKQYSELLLSDTRYFERKPREESGYFNNPKAEIERTQLSDGTEHSRETSLIVDEKLPSFISLFMKRKVGLLLICYPEISKWFSWSLPFLWFIIGIRENGFSLSFKEIFHWMSGGLRKEKGEPHLSLRKVVFDEIGMLSGDTIEMEPLRRGR